VRGGGGDSSNRSSIHVSITYTLYSFKSEGAINPTAPLAPVTTALYPISTSYICTCLFKTFATIMNITQCKIHDLEFICFYDFISFFGGILSTGGPPLTRKSLTRFPLPRFLAYVRVNGNFSASGGPQYSPTNTKMRVRRGPSVHVWLYFSTITF